MGTRLLLRSLPRGFRRFVPAVVVMLVVDDAWPDPDYFDADLFGLVLSYAIAITALIAVIGGDRLKRMLPRVAAALTVTLLSAAAALGAAEEATR